MPASSGSGPSRLARALPWLGLLAAAGAFLFPIRNPDLWWHLGCARRMLAGLGLPRTEVFSHTMAGSPWLDFEWLTQLLYYGVYGSAGWWGLLALRLVLMLLTLLASLRTLSLYGAGPAGRGLAALLLGATLFPYADLRPDNFSLLFFALLLWGLEARRLERLRLTPALGLAAAGMFALWANLHLGLVFGFGLILCYVLGEAVEALLPVVYGRGPAGPFSRCGDYLKLLAAAGAASLLNPYGWRLYQVAWEHAGALGQLQETICEWMPPDLTKFWTWPYWVLLLLVWACVLVHYLKTRRTPFALLAAIGYFGLASAAYQRHLSFFCLAAVPALFLVLRDLDGGGRWKRWAGAGLAAALLVFLPLYVWSFIPVLLRKGPAPPAPAGMSRFLEAEASGLRGRRLYNSWADGGYLAYALSAVSEVPQAPAGRTSLRPVPKDYRIFWDGRYVFHGMLAPTLVAARSASSWQAYMDRWGVEVACLKRSAKRFSMGTVTGPGGYKAAVPRPFYAGYMPGSVWALVFWDDENIVMARRSAAEPAWLRRSEYRCLGPDDQAFLVEQHRLGRIPPACLREELTRHLSQVTRAPGEEDPVAVLVHRLLRR